MTDLLAPERLRNAIHVGRRPGVGDDGPMRLSVGAALAGLAAAGLGLAVCWVVALAGWYSADGGSHGTTRSALRLGSDAWLLAHGSHLVTGDATVTAVPLGLTLLLAYALLRCGRRAGQRCAGPDLPRDVRPDLRGVGLGVVVLSGVYAVTAVLVAVLASTAGAQPGLMRSFVGAAAVSGLAGGLGLLQGSGRLDEAVHLVPREVRAAVYGAALIVLSMLALGAVAVAVALAMKLNAAANVLAELHIDTSGGIFSVLLVALAAPNLALMGAAYLLGPGFAVGTATVVAPGQVLVGAVPAVPVFAAIPSSGLGEPWASVVPLVPVLVAAWSVWRLLTRFPTRRYDLGVGRGAAAGALAAVLLTLGLAVAGGSIGPGRMSDLGPLVRDCLLVSLGAFGLTGGVVGAAFVFLRRRRIDADDDWADGPEPDRDSEDTTVVVNLGGEPTVLIPLPRMGKRR